ncbi:MAG TPA: Gfo/Idh/MocA family oxidoreductase [Chloroflexota bacterium]|nr:Gfo/Idh/MocA family oxidoreductase [Chloroflexota bacterium]
MEIRFRHEYDRRLRVALAGCGGHAYRNILPALNYLPVELVATCDIDAGRATAYARTFGAERAFGDYGELLKWAPEAGVEAVLLVLGFKEGLPQYRDFAIGAMERDLHVWMEKPPAATAGEVEQMLAAQRETGRTVQVGYKHYFFPALAKARSIVEAEEFGARTSMNATYPLRIAPAEQRAAPPQQPINLDLCHPASAIHGLMGDIASVWFDRAPNGGGIVALRFVNGAVGVLHCTTGKSGTSPNERFEVIGEGASVVVDNVVKLTYYRPGRRGRPGEGYGRTPEFFGADAQGPIHWEPEFNLGQLYNSTSFLQGYVPELAHFIESVWEGRQPARAGLRDALHLTHLYEAFRAAERNVVRLPRLEGAEA